MIRFACIAVLLFCSVASAQQRPLITEDVDIIPPGTIRIEAGIDFMQGAKYPVSGIRGDLTRVGVIGISSTSLLSTALPRSRALVDRCCPGAHTQPWSSTAKPRTVSAEKVFTMEGNSRWKETR